MNDLGFIEWQKGQGGERDKSLWRERQPEQRRVCARMCVFMRDFIETKGKKKEDKEPLSCPQLLPLHS